MAGSIGNLAIVLPKQPGTLTLKVGTEDGNTIAFGAEGEQIGERYVVTGHCHIADTAWLRNTVPGSFKLDSGDTLVADFKLNLGDDPRKWVRDDWDYVWRLEFEIVGATTLIPKPREWIEAEIAARYRETEEKYKPVAILYSPVLTAEKREQMRQEWNELAKQDSPPLVIENQSPRPTLTIDRSEGVKFTYDADAMPPFPDTPEFREYCKSFKEAGEVTAEAKYDSVAHQEQQREAELRECVDLLLRAHHLGLLNEHHYAIIRGLVGDDKDDPQPDVIAEPGDA